MAKLLLVLLLLPVAVIADDNWSERINEDGIQVLSKPVPDSRYQEFKATIEVQASLAQALALLQDNSACERWLFRCVESRVVKQISNTERYFQQTTSLPFPAKSRDSVFHATVTFNPDQSIKISLEAVPDYLPETKHVRVRDAHGEYLLEPIDDEKIRVTWQQYVDPAGALPAWLVNTMLTDLPFKSLQSFRDLIREVPYANATFELDENGAPINILLMAP